MNYMQHPRPARAVRAEKNPGPHMGSIQTPHGEVAWPVGDWRVQDAATGFYEVWSNQAFAAEFECTDEQAVAPVTSEPEPTPVPEEVKDEAAVAEIAYDGDDTDE